MTPLRKKMIMAMRQRGFSPRTHKSYLAAVTGLARYFRRSPERIAASELQTFFDYLVHERNLAPASCRVYLNGVRFLYLKVLEWPSFDVELVVPRRAQRIPELLTRCDVGRILAACRNPKHRMLLELTYGCGLRVSEIVALRVRDIDGERGLLRVEQGKGAKDRMVTLPETLRDRLRGYWTLCRPEQWLFPSSRAHGGSICLTKETGHPLRSSSLRIFIQQACLWTPLAIGKGGAYTSSGRADTRLFREVCQRRT